MILQDVQAFIHDTHLVSLAELELHFQMDGEALQQMLCKLMHKGRVRKAPTPDKCHGCTFCQANTLIFYEWIDYPTEVEAIQPQRSRRSIPCCQDQQSPDRAES